MSKTTSMAIASYASLYDMLDAYGKIQIADLDGDIDAIKATGYLKGKVLAEMTILKHTGK